MTMLIRYCRVSGLIQDTERQHAAYRRDVRKGGYEAAPDRYCYEDKISASDFSDQVRPDFERLKTDIAASHHDGAVLWLSEVSRGSRSIAAVLPILDLCKAHKVKWLVHGRVYDPANKRDLVDLQKAVIDAAEEVTVLSERVKDAVPVTLEKGRPHGRIPYGYLRTYDPVTREFVSQLEHPEHGPIVREIVRRYAAGESTGSIADDLNARGIPCPHNAKRGPKSIKGHWEGARWWPTDIPKRACMTVYLGKRVYEGTQEDLLGEYEGDWPALVTEDEHRACVARRAADAARKNPNTAQHWLTGVAQCFKDGDGREHYIHARPHHAVGQAYSCRRGCVNLPEADVDELALVEMAKVIADERTWLRVASEDVSAQLDALRNTLKAQEEELAIIQADKTVSRVGRLPLIAEAEADIKRTLAAMDALAPVTGPRRKLHDVPPAERWAVFLALPIHERRQLTRDMLVVTLHGVGRFQRRESTAQSVTITPV